MIKIKLNRIKRKQRIQKYTQTKQSKRREEKNAGL